MNGRKARELRREAGGNRSVYQVFKAAEHEDQGQHPKFKAERKRKPARGHPPTWPRTKDQRKQSRPVIVLHPVKQLRRMGMGGALLDMGNRLLNAPKWALDEMASDVRSSLKAALQDALRGQR